MTRYASCGTPPTHAYGVDHTRPVQIAGRHFNAQNDPISEADRDLAAQFEGDRPELVEPDAWREAGVI